MTQTLNNTLRNRDNQLPTAKPNVNKSIDLTLDDKAFYDFENEAELKSDISDQEIEDKGYEDATTMKSKKKRATMIIDLTKVDMSDHAEVF